MYQNYIKRMIDFIMALIGIIILSPILLILSIIIKVTSPGPIYLNKIESEKIMSNLKFWNLELWGLIHQKIVQLIC